MTQGNCVTYIHPKQDIISVAHAKIVTSVRNLTLPELPSLQLKLPPIFFLGLNFAEKIFLNARKWHLFWMQSTWQKCDSNDEAPFCEMHEKDVKGSGEKFMCKSPHASCVNWARHWNAGARDLAWVKANKPDTSAFLHLRIATGDYHHQSPLHREYKRHIQFNNHTLFTLAPWLKTTQGEGGKHF